MAVATGAASGLVLVVALLPVTVGASVSVMAVARAQGSEEATAAASEAPAQGPAPPMEATAAETADRVVAVCWPPCSSECPCSRMRHSRTRPDRADSPDGSIHRRSRKRQGTSLPCCSHPSMERPR